MTLTMRPDGQLSGEVGRPGMGEVTIREGRVDGAHFAMSFVIGTGQTVRYEGTVVNDTLRGRWTYDQTQGPLLGVRGSVPPRPEMPAVARAPGDEPLTAEERAATIDALAREIAARYFDPTRGTTVANELRTRARAGAYDSLLTVGRLSRVVTDELRRIDKHFGLLPAALGGPRFGPRDNYGIKRVERLNGNVGYLRLDTFVPDTATVAPLLRSALSLLSRTDALIIDLRTNPGGAAELNQLLISYLVPQRSLPLSTFVIRQGARSDSAIRMTASVIDERLAYVDRPVYILVSPHTASSAEWFTYNLQALKRVTVVGETTAGAAHPTSMFRLSPTFGASIPVGRATSLVTHTDFEGTGVKPDVVSPESRALDDAYRLALRAILPRADAQARAEVQRALEALDAPGRP